MALSMACGLDSAIVDPTDKKMMAIIKVAMTLLGEDPFCAKYIRAYREGDFYF